MPSLKEVRNRIASVNSTQQITKAMKMVAAAKLRRAQDRILQLRPYAQTLNGILQDLSNNNPDTVQSPYAEVRSIQKVLLIVITSDRGLCGAFNSNVAKFAVNLAHTTYASQLSQGKVHFLCLGKKGYEYFKKRKYPVVGEQFVNIFSLPYFDNIRKAAEFSMDTFAEGDYDKVEIIFNEFKNVATQILRREDFLPITSEQHRIDVASGIEKKSNKQIDYILEPSAEEVILDLIPKSLKIKLYRAVLESNAAEQGARMTAMDKATDNAGELLKQLRLDYNRSRQAAITKEILEIVGGAEALG